MRMFSVLFLLAFASVVICYNEEPVGVMERIKAGFEMAGKFLGLDQASKLAQMVSQTFSGKSQEHNQGSNIFSGFLRLLGLDSKKLGAIAINAIIFIAQLISSTLSKPPPSELTEARKIQGTPLDWMLNNSKIEKLLADIKDKNLPENIVEHIRERALTEDTDCVQLLICKSAPLIWGMQKTIDTSSKSSPKGRQALFANLPTVEEFSEHGDSCEEKHPYCLIHY